MLNCQRDSPNSKYICCIRDEYTYERVFDYHTAYNYATNIIQIDFKAKSLINKIITSLQFHLEDYIAYSKNIAFHAVYQRVKLDFKNPD